MTYQMLQQYNSPNYTAAANVPTEFGEPRNVQYITIHHWGDPSWGQTFEGVISYLCDGNRPNPTSAHYIAETGRVACIVTPDDAAWHAGTGRGNAESIGIECNPLERDGDYQTIGELIAYIRGIYGDVPLVPHNHWIQTDCPGTYDLNRLDAIARGTTPAAPTTPGGFLMALTDAQQTEILDGIRYITSPQFKADALTGKSSVEVAAQNTFGDFLAEKIVSHDFPWMGFNGQPQPAGGRTTTNIKTDLGFADSRAAGLAGLVRAIQSADPAAIAKEVVALQPAVDAKAVALEFGKLLSTPATA